MGFLASPKDKLPDLSDETIIEFMKKRKEHLRKANALVSKHKSGVLNSDAVDVLTIMYHKVMANVLLPKKRIRAWEYLCDVDKVESDEFVARRQLMEKVNAELIRISNLPMDPSFEDIKTFCKDEAILYWFERSPHCWEDEHCFGSVRDVVGTMVNIIHLIDCNFVEDGQPSSLPDCIAYGEFPIILEQVV